MYIKQDWKNLPEQTTPISASRLNHLETQYDEAKSYFDAEKENVISDAVQESQDYTDQRFDELPTIETVPPSKLFGDFDTMEVVAAFPIQKIGSEGYAAFQGFSVDEEGGILWVSYGSAYDTTQRIEKRDISSGGLLEYRILSAGTRSYSEGITRFYNSQNQLCFIVWLKSTTESPSEYQIYNWDTDSVSSGTEIKGRVRGEQYENLFVTSDAYGETASEFYVYSWDSIKNQSPELLQTVPLSNWGGVSEKIQGTTFTGDLFVIYGGAVEGKPTFSIFNNTGSLLSQRQYDPSGLEYVVSETSSFSFPSGVTNYEGEGVYYDGSYVFSGHYVGGLSIPGGSSSARQALILKHGTAKGVNLPPTPAEGDPFKWSPVSISSGFTNSSGLNLEARRESNKVYLRGRVNHPSDKRDPTGSGYIIGNLPEGLRPERATMCVTAGGGSTSPVFVKTIIESSGDIKVCPGGTTPWVDYGGVFYFL